MSHDQLPYNFYNYNLWSIRFHSIDDALDSNFKLHNTIWSSFGQLSRDEFNAWVRDNGLDKTFYDQLRDMLPEASEASLDPAFEAMQLFNLYTFNRSLNSFALGSLPRVVKNSFTSHQPPPVQDIRRTFRHIAHDIEIIQRAIVQRRREQDTAGNTLMSAPAKAALVMDKLALLSLAPSQHLLPSDTPVVPITYFSEYTHIHRTPYKDDVLLIGVSYDIVPLELNRVFATVEEVRNHPPAPAFELMAIPHEVGHYVYHHGRFGDGQGPTFDAIAQHEMADHPYFHWCEEIFADIYACLIAGPLAALGLQALLVSSDSHELCANDWEHPTAVLRPFILSHILQKTIPQQFKLLKQAAQQQFEQLVEQAALRYQFDKAAHRLAENWTQMLQLDGFYIEGAFGDDDFVAIQPKDDNEPIYIGHIVNEIAPLLDQLCKLLLSQLDLSVSGIPWSQSDYADLHDYDKEMARLTAFEFASAPIKNKPVSFGYRTAQSLTKLLSGWGDSGPLTIGGHTLKADEIETLYNGNDKQLRALAEKIGTNTTVLTNIKAKYSKEEVTQRDITV